MEFKNIMTSETTEKKAYYGVVSSFGREETVFKGMPFSSLLRAYSKP